MTQFESLKISTSSLMHSNEQLIRFIDSNFYKIIFYPGILDADVDCEEYCSLVHSIRSYAAHLDHDIHTKPVKDKLNKLPLITKADFRLYNLGIPASLLYVLLPVGIYSWIDSYSKLTQLRGKLSDVGRTTGTLHLMLKALTS